MSISFRDGLIEMHARIYHLNRNSKIEVLNGNIYVNCFSIKTLLSVSNLKNDTMSSRYIYVKTIKAYCEK